MSDRFRMRRYGMCGGLAPVDSVPIQTRPASDRDREGADHTSDLRFGIPVLKDTRALHASRLDLVGTMVAMTTTAFADKPAIGTDDELKQTLLRAKSVAYSDSASGVYIEKELFKKLGVQEQLAPKSKMIERVPVASVVAKGDYQVGFQQVAELLPVPGVTFVGKIPEDVQSVTRYAAGVPKKR